MLPEQKSIGRNDPCWCGSGKKYKHCHQRADEERASEKLQKNALWHALGEFALQRKYEIEFRTAAKFFFDADDAPDPEGDADEQANFGRALDYFLFDYRLPDNARVIEHFATERGYMLSPQQRTWLAGWLTGAPALLEIVAVQRGIGVKAHDLLTHETYDIRDKLGSETVSRWDIAFTRVLRTEDHYELAGSGLNVPPRFRGMLCAFVQGLLGEYLVRFPDATPNEFMRAHAQLINQYILDAIAAAMQQLPLLLTPERDLMEQAFATYRVLNHADALARLRAAPEFDESPSDARDTHTFAWNEAGESLAQLRAHGAPFERQTPVGDANSVRALGTVTLSFDELTLDVISRRRLLAGKALLEKHLGATVALRDEKIESFADAMAEHGDGQDELDDEPELNDEFEDGKAWADDDGMDSKEAAFEPALPNFALPPAELQAHLANYRANYNQTWMDLRLPALDNETPRQAVQSFGGRIQVIRLLKDFEAREVENARRGETAFDWSTVAQELGLSEQEFLDETRVEDDLHESVALLMDLTFLHQTDQASQLWQQLRTRFPFQRAEDLWFAQVWDLEAELTDAVMSLEFLLARQKRFDGARAVLDDYIALEADAWEWALAERQAVEVERAIFDEPAAVQATVAELERLAQKEDTAFQALIVLAELQEGLLHAPGTAIETLRRAEQAAADEMEEQRVYDTMLEYFDSFHECDAGKSYWHQNNDELASDERDNAGLVRLLLACGEFDEAAAVVAEMERVETREYFEGMVCARRGDLDTARRLWKTRLSEGLEQLAWRWSEWTEMSLYLRDSGGILDTLDPAAYENHYMVHWYRAMAYAQQDDLVNAARAADDARGAMRDQERRMDYDAALRRKRSLALRIGLSDAAMRALNPDAPVE